METANKSETLFFSWKTEHDRLCVSDFYIDTNDTGRSDSELAHHWKDGSTHPHMVDYLLQKYDIETLSNYLTHV